MTGAFNPGYASDPSNDLEQGKAFQSFSHVRSLEQQVSLLQRRMRMLEGALATLMGIDPASFSLRLDRELAVPLPARSYDDLAKETVPCARCSRPVHRSLSRCQICGMPRDAASRSG